MFAQWRADYNHPLIVQSSSDRKLYQGQTPVNDKDKDQFWDLMRGVEKERNQPAFSKEVKNTKRRFNNEVRSSTGK